MVVQLRPRTISVDRGSRGFGLSLIYRGLDKYEEKDTGIFVARVVPGGQAQRFGVREHDKILTINNKAPRNVDDAVGVIKQAGSQIKLVVLREEDDAADDRTSLASHDINNSSWHREPFGQPISRSGSARSFNTTFGRTGTGGAPMTPSPGPQRAHLGSGGQQQSMPSPVGTPQQQEFLRQQAEYRRQQQAEAERLNQVAQQQQQQQHAETERLNQLAQQQQQHIAQQQQQIARQQEEIRLRQLKQMQEQEPISVNTVRNILATSDFGFDPPPTRPKSVQDTTHGGRITEQETRTMKETKTVETSGSGKYKSTQSLHELGLEGYPNPDMPTSSRLTRKEEKQSLQNLNNRLAGYIDRVRQLQNENHKLFKQIKSFEEHKTVEMSSVKEIYDRQIEELQRALENMNKQYNQLKVGAEGLLHENEDLKDKLKRKDNDFLNSQSRASSLEDELRNLGNKMSRVEDEHRRTKDRLQEVLPELESLRSKLAEAKRHLDEEQLKNADLENTCERLEEDLKFKMQLLEKELAEVKHRKEMEIHEMDGKLQDEYEDRLQKALEELRDVYDKKMQENRDDLAKLYDDRVKDLQSQLSNERSNSSTANQGLKEARSRIEALISKVTDLENANLALNQKISDMAQDMEDKKAVFRAQLLAKDAEIKRLLDELSEQLKHYQTLQDVKIALDMEIAVFKRLIESEEDRLGMGDRTLDSSDSKSDVKTVEKTSSESSFQRKITVSQTQL